MYYDFEIIDLATRAPVSALSPDGAMRSLERGISGLDVTERDFAEGASRRYLALFRKSGAIAALNAAPDEIRSCFLQSGFGLALCKSSAPPGRYHAADAPMRRVLLARLCASAPAGAAGVAEGGFDIAEFFRQAETARALAPFLTVKPERRGSVIGDLLAVDPDREAEPKA